MESGAFQIRFRKKSISTSSPLLLNKRYTLKEKIRQRVPKKTTYVSSRRKWNKSDELLILKGIVDYQKETNISYKSDWDAFFRHIKYPIDANFSKHNIMTKVKELKKRFRDKPVEFDNRKGPSFANTEDDQVFKWSNIIWATKNETQEECGSNEILDQAKDVPNVELGRVRKLGKEIDQDSDKQETEQDKFCVLQNALEETSVFPGVQHKLLLHNLKKLKAEKRKEFSDEWKALHLEQLQLNIKKVIFATKLASV